MKSAALTNVQTTYETWKALSNTTLGKFADMVTYVVGDYAAVAGSKTCNANNTLTLLNAAAVASSGPGVWYGVLNKTGA